MKVYEITKTLYRKVIAETDEQAIEIAKQDDNWERETYYSNERVNADEVTALYNSLKSFRNSECEKEWVKISDLYEEDFFGSMALLKEFIEKGEYKAYGGVVGNPKYDCTLTFEVGNLARWYELGCVYDIDEDIANLEERYGFLKDN